MAQVSRWSSGRHEGKVVDLPAGFVAGFAQGGEKDAAVGVITEDLPTTVAPAHEVVNGTRVLDAQGAAHNGIATPSGRIVNYWNRPRPWTAVVLPLVRQWTHDE